MKAISVIAAAAIAAALALHAHAQSLEPAPKGCYKDLMGKVSCPPLGGEVHVTLDGVAVCGKGKCVRDLFGKITCSAQPGGQVIQEISGQVRCAGSCEEASAAYCQQLQ